MSGKITYYALFEDVTEGKTAKYTITHQAGEYKPLEKLADDTGKVSVFLLPSRDSGCRRNAPLLRLQARGSLNVTGLKGLFGGCAYGYPMGAATYGKEKRPNPFCGCGDDGFLFLLHQNQGEERPHSIEIMVLRGKRRLIATYCGMLRAGDFCQALERLREMAGTPQASL